MGLKFAITGAAGFVAPRHLDAIRAVGGEVIAALDPSDSLGILDRYNTECETFQGEETFWKYLADNRVDYVSICTPNDLHVEQTRRALKLGFDVICEKPIALNPSDLDYPSRRVWPVLQLRLNRALRDLAEDVRRQRTPSRVDVQYITRRGKWYHRSWKGDSGRSGTILMNLGVHVFDALTWIFGTWEPPRLIQVGDDQATGTLFFGGTRVEWEISCRESDLPGCEYAHRELLVEGVKVADLSDDFEVNHARVYEKIVAGEWIDHSGALPAIELVSELRGIQRLGAVA